MRNKSKMRRTVTSLRDKLIFKFKYRNRNGKDLERNNYRIIERKPEKRYKRTIKN